MATIDNKDIIAEMLNHEGWYPGDPQAHSIWSYTNMEGELTQSVYWPSRLITAQIMEFIISPFVRDPLVLWSQKDGLTEEGKKWMKEFGNGR